MRLSYGDATAIAVVCKMMTCLEILSADPSCDSDDILSARHSEDGNVSVEVIEGIKIEIASGVAVVLDLHPLPPVGEIRSFISMKEGSLVEPDTKERGYSPLPLKSRFVDGHLAPVTVEFGRGDARHPLRQAPTLGQLAEPLSHAWWDDYQKGTSSSLGVDPPPLSSPFRCRRMAEKFVTSLALISRLVYFLPFFSVSRSFSCPTTTT